MGARMYYIFILYILCPYMFFIRNMCFLVVQCPVQDRKPLVEDVPEVPKELEETIAKAMLDEDLEQAQEADAEIRKVGPNKHFDFATSLM